MIHVDDLIEPGAKQILLPRLSPFPWPHPNLPLKHAAEQRIMIVDSTESLSQFCKKIDPVTANSGKSISAIAQIYPVASGNSEFFTDD